MTVRFSTSDMTESIVLNYQHLRWEAVRLREHLNWLESELDHTRFGSAKHDQLLRDLEHIETDCVAIYDGLFIASLLTNPKKCLFIYAPDGMWRLQGANTLDDFKYTLEEMKWQLRATNFPDCMVLNVRLLYKNAEKNHAE